MWLQFVQVNVNHLIVLTSLVRSEQICILSSILCEFCSSCCSQVSSHALIEWEDGGGSPDLCSHVANGCHTGARDGLHTRSIVLNNCSCTSLYSENVSNLQDDVLWRGPVFEGTSEVDSNNLWCLELPWQSSHYVNSVSSSNTNSNNAQTSCVHSVRISTNHESTWECIILQYNLMNDTRSWFPETNSVFCSRRSEEVIHLLVCLDSSW
mmetsp:Transcript_9262/g.34262  ORF Transcript_9262/g.34262 Transcript_9262/m.34262 type:complete len:209 (+) Transcript_9262:1368-1994(+)